MAQTMRHLAVLTDFVPQNWHDLAHHVAGHCGNKIRASVRLGHEWDKRGRTVLRKRSLSIYDCSVETSSSTTCRRTLSRFCSSISDWRSTTARTIISSYSGKSEVMELHISFTPPPNKWLWAPEHFYEIWRVGTLDLNNLRCKNFASNGTLTTDYNTTGTEHYIHAIRCRSDDRDFSLSNPMSIGGLRNDGHLPGKTDTCALVTAIIWKQPSQRIRNFLALKFTLLVLLRIL